MPNVSWIDCCPLALKIATVIVLGREVVGRENELGAVVGVYELEGNLVRIRARTRLALAVAGESNRLFGLGTDGNDPPGTPIPPDRDTLARGKSPVSTAPGTGVTPGSDGGSPEPWSPPLVGKVSGWDEAEPAGSMAPTWRWSRSTTNSSWRIRSSSWASRGVGAPAGIDAAGKGGGPSSDARAGPACWANAGYALRAANATPHSTNTPRNRSYDLDMSVSHSTAAPTSRSADRPAACLVPASKTVGIGFNPIATSRETRGAGRHVFININIC